MEFFIVSYPSYGVTEKYVVWMIMSLDIAESAMCVPLRAGQK